MSNSPYRPRLSSGCINTPGLPVSWPERISRISVAEAAAQAFDRAIKRELEREAA